MAARVAVLVSGGGTNLQAILDFNRERGSFAASEVVLVASNRASAGGLDRARAAGIAAQVFDSTDDGSSLLSLLTSHNVSLVVLAGYLKRLPASVVKTYHRRIINIHPGLLPDFGGAGMYGSRVHAAVLEAGATTTGVTAHFVDDEFDHGPRIAEWRVPVQPGDTVESLAARVLAVEHVMYPRIIDLVASLNERDFFADF
jgi:phosphoribosylglycinamide formyltransferase-1